MSVVVFILKHALTFQISINTKNKEMKIINLDKRKKKYKNVTVKIHVLPNLCDTNATVTILWEL